MYQVNVKWDNLTLFIISTNHFVFFFISDDLTVDASGINLNANTVWGALRGLETFSQIIFTRNSQVINIDHVKHNISDFWKNKIKDISGT